MKEKYQYTKEEQCSSETHTDTHTLYIETSIIHASAKASCICHETEMHFQNQICVRLCQVKWIKHEKQTDSCSLSIKLQYYIHNQYFTLSGNYSLSLPTRQVNSQLEWAM